MTSAIDRLLGDDVDFALLTEEELREYLRLAEQIVGKSWDLTPKQLYAEAVWSKVDWLLFGGSAGGGKATRLDELIATPDGFTKMADVHVGDHVLGRDGKSHLVTAESEVMFLPGWRLTFDDKSTIEVNDDHLWLTFDARELRQLTQLDPERRAQRRERRQSRSDVGAGTKLNHSAEHRLALSRRLAEWNRLNPPPTKAAPTGTVRTTAEIVATLTTERGRRNHAVPVTAALDLPERDLLVDPYVLGVWLGDGTSANGEITTMDAEITAAVEAAGYPATSVQDKANCRARSYYHSGLLADLRAINVLKNKHIPHDYLWSSEAQRLALLQGLMDTDGTANKEGGVEFCSTNQALADGVAHLARSLGMKARVREGRAKLYGKDCGPKWTVLFTANRPVFRLDRKLSLQRQKPRRSTAFRFIVAAERVEAQPMKCISVAAPDRLYLATEHLIPTHNSEFACHHVARLSEEIPNHSSLLVRQSIPELRRSLIIRLLTRVKQFGLPARYRKVDGQSAFHFENGSIVECGHLATDEHLGNYLSAEYGCIIIDEASQLTPEQIMGLSARLRVTHEMREMGARPHLGLFTNPGDRSHAWLYDMFVVPSEYGAQIVVFDVSQGMEKAWPVRTYRAPVDVRTASPTEILDVLVPWAEQLEVKVRPETELSVAFVPSSATDNPHIDRSYLKFLNALPERRRRQLRDGDWDTFEGQYFASFSRNLHVVEPFEIPEGWQRARGLDFGSTAPFCCLWGAWDNDGNCYIYREAYGANLTPIEQARMVASMSVDANGRKEKYSASVADPSVFYDKRGTGKSIADLWRDGGLHVTKARNQRIAGWANVRQYMWDSERKAADGQMGAPRVFIFSTCTNLLRTIPLMQHDKRNGEDLDTRLEDHAVDAWRYLLSVRPIEMVERKRPGSSLDDRFQLMMRRMDKRGKRRSAWS